MTLSSITGSPTTSVKDTSPTTPLKSQSHKRKREAESSLSSANQPQDPANIPLPPSSKLEDALTMAGTDALIFSFIPFEINGEHPLQRVNKALHDNFSNMVAISCRSLDFCDWNFSATKKFVERLPPICTAIGSIKGDELTDEIFSMLVQKCPNIATIELEDGCDVEDINCIQRLPSLRHFSYYSDGKGISDEFMATLASCTGLEQLTLRDANVGETICQFPDSLIALDITGCIDDEDEIVSLNLNRLKKLRRLYCNDSFIIFQDLLELTPQLTHLHIGTVILESAEYILLFRRLNKLIELNVCDSLFFDDAAFRAVPQTVTSLNFSGCTKLSSQTIATVIGSRRWVSLILSENITINKACLAALLPSKDTLEDLTLIKCRTLLDGDFETLNQFTKLQTLNLSQTQAGSLAARSLPGSLIELDVSYCPSLQHEDYKAILQRLPRLKTLYISQNPQANIEILKKAFPRVEIEII